MRRSIWLGQLFFLVVVGGAGAALPYYVLDAGNAQSSAGDAAGNDFHQYNSGKLVQQSVSGSTASSYSGLALEFGSTNVINVQQTAHGDVTDKAEIGALHASLGAHSDTELYTVFNVPSDVGAAATSINDTVMWSDTVNFNTSNPAGSDYLLSLDLDDSISGNGVFYYYEQGFYSGSVLARIDFTNSNFGLGASQDLVVQDVYSQNANGTFVDQVAPSHGVSVLIHAGFGQGATVTVTSELVTTAGAQNGTSNILVDAGDTALFTISSADPLASYTTNSGTVFATSVPEPGAAWVALGTMFWARRRRLNSQIP